MDRREDRSEWIIFVLLVFFCGKKTVRREILTASKYWPAAISPLEERAESHILTRVTTAVANTIAKMTKRQKLALADRLLVEAGAKSSVTKTGRKPTTARPRFVRSKLTGMIVSTGPKGAPRVTSEQVRALLADFP